MVRIKVVIEDDQGNVIRESTASRLELGQQSLHDIEGAVEGWRQQILPEIEAELLQTAQTEFTKVKKTNQDWSVTEPEKLPLRPSMGSFGLPYNATKRLRGVVISLN